MYIVLKVVVTLNLKVCCIEFSWFNCLIQTECIRKMPSMTVFECVFCLNFNRKMVTHDRRSEPRVGERVPYVIIYGTPGVPLIQLVRRPGELLQDPTLRLNAIYYITKQILPPLARIFSLIGIDVFSWYHELPRVSVLEHTCVITVSLKIFSRTKGCMYVLLRNAK